MGERIKRLKEGFDKITSQNATNWQLILFWIIVFELIASIIEFIFLENSSKLSMHLNHTLITELTLAFFVTAFVWYCIYNIIFESKKNILRLGFIGIIGLYFIVTSDFSLRFLVQNLNPFHFFELEVGTLLFIEILFKIIILYLLYQLWRIFKKRAGKL